MVPLAKGGFSPLATTPAADGSRAWTFGSFDSAKDLARVDATVQVQILPMLQIVAGLDYDEETSDPTISAQVDVLRESSSSLDLQVAAGWDDEGINNTSAVFGEVAAGRTFGNTYVYGSSRVDIGTDGDEAGLRLGAAAVRPVADNIVVGADSRVDVDLARDSSEPMGESGWALQVGPVVGYAQDLLAVTASVGLAANEPRETGDATVGAYAGAGFGIAF